MMMGSPTVSLVEPDSPLVERTADDGRAAKSILIYNRRLSESRVNTQLFYETLQEEYKDKTVKLAVISVATIITKIRDGYSYYDRQRIEGTPQQKMDTSAVRITLITIENIPNLFTKYHVQPLQYESDRLFEFCFDYPFPHHLKAMALMPLLLM